MKKTAKKVARNQPRPYGDQVIEALISRLSSVAEVSDMELQVLLFLLERRGGAQQSQDDLLRQIAGRLREVESHIQTQQAIQQVSQVRRPPPRVGPPQQTPFSPPRGQDNANY